MQAARNARWRLSVERKEIFPAKSSKIRLPFLSLWNHRLRSGKIRLAGFEIQIRLNPVQLPKPSRIPLCFAISEDRSALCKTSPPMSVRVCQCPSESANVRPSPPLSVQVRHCPSKSANVRPSPPMSVYVRQCPSKSANVRLCPPMSQKPRPLSHRIQKGQDIGGHRRTWHPPPIYSHEHGINPQST